MQAVTFFLAFVAVLALIGVAAWLVRRFAGNRLGANTNRGRMPRLAVIDAAAVDGRRRLGRVRRGNIENLLMIARPPRPPPPPPRPGLRPCPIPATGATATARGWTASIMPSRKCRSRRRGR